MEDDKAAVLEVLNAETEAWLRRDLDALARHWVHSSDARRMSSVDFNGSHVQEGWTAICAALKSMAEQYPATFAETRVRHERMNIVVHGDTAWVSYDQVGEKSDDDFEMVGTQHELKIFHRVDGEWKIIAIVVMQRTIDLETCPLIEKTAQKRVLWMNAFAHEQINDHVALLISGGCLRARNWTFEPALQEAVDWANRQLHRNAQLTALSRPVRPVVLGESDRLQWARQLIGW